MLDCLIRCKPGHMFEKQKWLSQQEQLDFDNLRRTFLCLEQTIIDCLNEIIPVLVR